MTDPITYLECPCCGDDGAESADGLFYDGQPLICGCPGHVSIDDSDNDAITADITNGDEPCPKCLSITALVAKWREREQSYGRKADAQGHTQYGAKLATQADEVSRCAAELDAVRQAQQGAGDSRPAGDASLIERQAETFAMEFLTGHYRSLREDERQRFEQLKVVMLAFASHIRKQPTAPLPSRPAGGSEQLGAAAGCAYYERDGEAFVATIEASGQGRTLHEAVASVTRFVATAWPVAEDWPEKVPDGAPREEGERVRDQLLEILNRNLVPWTFTGEEPFTQELLRLLAGGEAEVQRLRSELKREGETEVGQREGEVLRRWSERMQDLEAAKDAAEAEVQRLRQNLADAEHFGNTIERLNVINLDRAVKAEGEVQRLREALKTYGRHKRDCPAGWKADTTCGCGYLAALTAGQEPSKT